MSKEVLEGEVVGQEQRPQTRKQQQENLGTALRFPGWKLLISLIPIIGLVFAIVWFYYEKNKNRPSIVFTTVGVVLGIFSTTTFVVLRFIVKAIF